MKKYMSFNNLLFLLAGIYAAYSLVPVVINNFSKEGKTIPTQEYLTIVANGPGEKILFPPKGRSIAIFWATWCAPCKLEMARLSASVEEGKIPKGAIVAINPFESTEKVRSFLKEHSYPFTFIEDKDISSFLNVSKTPTTLFIEDQKIEGLSSGLSFIGIWKAEQFL